jgi:DNA-binding MarR family transcriptional regulator
VNGDVNEALPEVEAPQPEGTASKGESGEGDRVIRLRSTIEDRKLRSFDAYLEVLDTAEWLRRQLIGQLEAFDLTIDGFRLMDMLYREGPIMTEEFCKRRRCSRQSFDALIDPLEEREWVKFEVIRLEPLEFEQTHLAERLRDQPRSGRRMGRVSLTPAGKNFMYVVFPRHSKLVFGFMRALTMREVDTLGRVCRKLREVV